MGYPDTTDAFAITDIKNWSTFTRKEVSSRPAAHWNDC
jgi:alcohol dehydrogenase (NADP+)